MIRKLSFLGLALGLALSACGDDSTKAITPAAEGGDPPAPVCIGESEVRAPEWEGLTVEEVETKAADEGFVIRELGRDGECVEMITMDLRDDRVNIEVAGDVVIAASIY